MFNCEYSISSLEDGIANLGEVMVCTSGYSMWPMLRNRKDMVIVEKVTRPLKKHDVPVYRLKSGKVVMHRIIKITRDGKYIIRGDNCYVNEHGITDDNIIGVLREFYRGGKHCVCATSKAYKLYVFYVRTSYPFRFVFKKLMKELRKIPLLRKIKRAIFPKK